MFKKIVSFLFKDIQWKLLSLVLSFALWLVAFNVTNPYVTETFTTTLVPTNSNILIRDNIRALNMAALESTTVEVTIRAKETELERIKNSPSLLEASIDLRNILASEVHESDNPVVIQAAVNTDIGLDDYVRLYVKPDTVSVRLDKYVNKVFNIQVNEIGEVAEGYELIDTETGDRTVTVSAPKSVLDRVYEVRAGVDVMGATGSVSSVAKLVAYDKDINDMTGEVELSITETEVSATVLQYKEVNLAVETTGVPAYNHITTGVTVSPQKIFVVGLPEVLAETNTVYLQPQDINGLSEPVSTTVDIRQTLPSNLQLRQGESSEAVVTINVEPLVTREYAYPINMIKIAGYGGSGYAARIVDMESVPIVVRGSATAMAAMDVSLINAQLNLSGLDVGQHIVDLTVTVPANIEIINSPTVTVEMSEALPEEEPLPDDAQTEETDPLAQALPAAEYGIDSETGEVREIINNNTDETVPAAEPTAEPADDLTDEPADEDTAAIEGEDAE